MTVICEFGIVGLGWAESGSIEGAIAGGSRRLQVVDSFFLLSPKGPLLALVEQQDSQQQQPAAAAAEEEEEGKRGRQGTVGHSAGGGCTVQEGPVRFSNSNSIAAIKEQPGQSRRGKAGTICWWRRRESWEWIGPTATGGDSMAVCLFCCCGCWCCYRNKRAQVLSPVTALAGLDIACRRAKIWIDGQSVGQNSPSTCEPLAGCIRPRHGEKRPER